MAASRADMTLSTDRGGVSFDGGARCREREVLAVLGGPGQLVACIAGRKKKVRRLEHLCVWQEGTATRAGGVVVHRWFVLLGCGPL